MHVQISSVSYGKKSKNKKKIQGALCTLVLYTLSKFWGIHFDRRWDHCACAKFTLNRTKNGENYKNCLRSKQLTDPHPKIFYKRYIFRPTRMRVQFFRSIWLKIWAVMTDKNGHRQLKGLCGLCFVHPIQIYFGKISTDSDASFVHKI